MLKSKTLTFDEFFALAQDGPIRYFIDQIKDATASNNA